LISDRYLLNRLSNNVTVQIFTRLGAQPQEHSYFVAFPSETSTLSAQNSVESASINIVPPCPLTAADAVFGEPIADFSKLYGWNFGGLHIRDTKSAVQIFQGISGIYITFDQINLLPSINTNTYTLINAY